MANNILNLLENYNIFSFLQFIVYLSINIFAIVLTINILLYCKKTIPELKKDYMRNKSLRSNIYLGKNLITEFNNNRLKIFKVFSSIIYIFIFIFYLFNYSILTFDFESLNDDKEFTRELKNLIIDSNLTEKETNLNYLIDGENEDIFIKYISINEVKDSKDNILINLENKKDYNESELKEIIKNLKEKKITLTVDVDYLLNSIYKSKTLELNLILLDKEMKLPEFSITNVKFNLNEKDISFLNDNLSKITNSYIMDTLKHLEDESIYPLNNIILNESLLLKLIEEEKIEVNFRD